MATELGKNSVAHSFPVSTQNLQPKTAHPKAGIIQLKKPTSLKPCNLTLNSPGVRLAATLTSQLNKLKDQYEKMQNLQEKVATAKSTRLGFS